MTRHLVPYDQFALLRPSCKALLSLSKSAYAIAITAHAEIAAVSIRSTFEASFTRFIPFKSAISNSSEAIPPSGPTKSVIVSLRASRHSLPHSASDIGASGSSTAEGLSDRCRVKISAKFFSAPTVMTSARRHCFEASAAIRRRRDRPSDSSSFVTTLRR